MKDFNDRAGNIIKFLTFLDDLKQILILNNEYFYEYLLRYFLIYTVADYCKIYNLAKK